MDFPNILSCTVDMVQGMNPQQQLGTTLILTLIFSKSHFYRSFKKIIPFSIIGFLAYRQFNENNDGQSILTLVGNSLHSEDATVNTLVGDILGLWVLFGMVSFFDKVLTSDFAGTKKAVFRYFFGLVKDLWFVKSMMKKEADKAEEEFEHDLKSKTRALGPANVFLPLKGHSGASVLKLIKAQATKENCGWKEGKISGAVYHGGDDHRKLLNKCFAEYSVANPLHADVWPTLMKFESEIISMTASLVSGGDTGVCGATTSGGTDSIISAIKAHRDYYRDNFGITKPEMIAGLSAHAAVDKACDLLQIKLVKIPIDSHTFKVNVTAVRRAIGPNTIMMYASAPGFPHGVIDPIRELGALAVKYNIGLHVDCCLGGFFLPFARKLGHSFPDFDFSVPGVSSMSLDTHKYGYALKGTSVVLYRNKELRQSQYFCYSDWQGGMYTTATIAGSRSGGMLAQTWASMMTLGETGYVESTRQILDVVKNIADGVKQIPGLRLVGQTEAMMVCCAPVENFGKSINMYSLTDLMGKKGWHVNSTQNPPCLNICCTLAHVGHADDFVRDLTACTAELRANPQMLGRAAIYGLTAQLPAAPVNELLKVYNDVVLSI